MINTVLILDTETTGLHPAKGAKLIEVGAILYSVKHRAILQCFSSLFPCEENQAEEINHISAELTQEKMAHTLFVPQLTHMADIADVCIAHNAEFDIKFLDLLEPKPMPAFSMRKWVCTKKDFKWPVPLYRQRLEDICNAMGVPYVDAHRALIDCHFIALCFNKIPDLALRLEHAKNNSYSNGIEL